MRTILVLVSLCVSIACAQSVVIKGDVAAPLTLAAADITAITHETVSVTEKEGSKVSYEGVPLLELLKRARVPTGKDLRGKALASYLVARGHDGYQVVFSLGEIDATFGNETIILADKRDGKPMAESMGPFRLVIPSDKAGARSVRMLESIEVVRLAK